MAATSSPKLLSDGKYEFLKKSALLILPLLSSLYFGLDQIWHFTHGPEVNGTIAVVNTFVGALVLAAKKLHDVSGAGIDGTMTIEEGEEDSTLRLSQVDVKALDEKDIITFKIERVSV